MNSFVKFMSQEDGAITVDWVLLTAGLVGLGALVVFTIAEPVAELDGKIGSALSSVEVADPNLNGGGN